jgi:hypothetical protein
MNGFEEGGLEVKLCCMIANAIKRWLGLSSFLSCQLKKKV